MLYYRRKILLAIMEVFGGRISAIQLQKYLFLFSRLQTEKTYHFVPYKYGCFSFQANQDMMTLGTYGYLEFDGNNYSLVDNKQSYLAMLNMFDQQYIRNVFDKFSSMTQEELITYTYIKYPYYAINSAIANQLLTVEQMEKVKQQKPRKDSVQLYTIGYEGVSLEEYINKLIVLDIPVLCDVRKNAYSQKYGFSKSQLQKACEGVGIKYIHIPELGITSDKRQCLSTQADYDILFKEYEETVLRTAVVNIEFLSDLLKKNQRIALTCFEKKPIQCHRSRVAKAVMQYTNNQYPLTHIQF